MPGFSTDPLEFINLIKDNIRDRYKSGFPVLKEIIQNADDAGKANEVRMEFGLTQGLPEAAHPLLQGPALFFINDGHFDESDRNAILSFGINRKAMDESAIGKFGLGMKSVFHFCEAFFFFAENGDCKYGEILNPWAGDKDIFDIVHADWEEFLSNKIANYRIEVKNQHGKLVALFKGIVYRMSKDWELPALNQ